LSWATFFFLGTVLRQNSRLAHPFYSYPVGRPTPRRKAGALPQQDACLLSFEQPPPLPCRCDLGLTRHTARLLLREEQKRFEAFSRPP
jgi:hypothetical protein